MGFRRWTIALLVFVIAVGGATEAINHVAGPYDVNCVDSSPRGFQVILTSWKTGQSTFVPVPLGGCPGPISAPWS